MIHLENRSVCTKMFRQGYCHVSPSRIDNELTGMADQVGLGDPFSVRDSEKTVRILHETEINFMWTAVITGFLLTVRPVPFAELF